MAGVEEAPCSEGGWIRLKEVPPPNDLEVPKYLGVGGQGKEDVLVPGTRFLRPTVKQCPNDLAGGTVKKMVPVTWQPGYFGGRGQCYSAPTSLKAPGAKNGHFQEMTIFFYPGFTIFYQSLGQTQP